MDWIFSFLSLNFGIFDIILLSVALIGGICGIAIGFTRSVAKILGYIFCFPFALIFTSSLSNFLKSYINIPQFWLSLISYVVLCILIFTLFKLLGNLIGTSLETLSLGWIDSILGFLFYVALSVVILFVLLELVSLQSFVDFMPLKENSFFYTNIYLPLFPSMEKAFKGALLGLR